MFKEHIQRLLKELSIEGGEPLPQELSSYTLDIDGVRVNMTDTPPGIEYTATLGYLPDENVEEKLILLLRGNFLGQATRRAYLGLDESGKQVLATMSIPTVRSYKEFQDMLEDFANVVNFWKSQVTLK